MNDLIDRMAAIDAVKNTDVVVLYHDTEPVEEAIEEIIEATKRSAEASIEALPSAQPEQDREFIKLTVRNSNGRPYYSIIYLEFDDNGVGHDFEGYSSYSLDVISDYLKKYFMPSAQADWNELMVQCDNCGHMIHVKIGGVRMAKFTGGNENIISVGEPIVFENKTESNYEVCAGIVFHNSGIYEVSVDGNRTIVSKVPERKTGKWIDGKCNQCGNHAPFWSMASTYYESKFCPDCGAKMEESEDIPMEYFESGGR